MLKHVSPLSCRFNHQFQTFPYFFLAREFAEHGRSQRDIKWGIRGVRSFIDEVFSHPRIQGLCRGKSKGKLRIINLELEISGGADQSRRNPKPSADYADFRRLKKEMSPIFKEDAIIPSGGQRHSWRWELDSFAKNSSNEAQLLNFSRRFAFLADPFRRKLLK